MLHPGELVTLRREGDFGTSKNWRLDWRCRVDPPNQKTFSLVRAGREKTLWAVISNDAHTVQLVRRMAQLLRLRCWQLLARWPHRVSRTVSQLPSEIIVLCLL